MRAHHVLACSAVAMGVVFSCGPFVPQAIFTAGERPRIPINEYAAGKLGVIQPAFEDEYLIIAYRTVSGRPLTAREQSSLQSIVSKEQPVADWLAERRRVIADETKTVEQYRAVPGDKWQTYLNCPDDAFRNAARTLRARIGQFGAAAATGWVKAQDRVFQNCAAGTSIPEATESGTPAIIAADRAYQIAAAHFYSEQFDAARTRFSAIAGDTSSPWHEIAPYLVARAWLREATLSGDRTKLERAVQELRRVGASRLANFAELRLDPGARLREVELELLDPAKGDFGEKLAEWNYARRKGANPSRELGEWIASLKNGTSLIGRLMQAKAADPQLLREAAAVKPHSPVYATVLYHRVRLSAPDDARRLLDEFLPELRKTQPVSAVNLFLAQRLALARDLSEFLRAAPRQPVAVVYDTEQPVEPGKQKLMLAEDSTQVLNEEMPIAMLAEAAESDTWPVHLRSEVAVSAFARAVVTGDVTTAAKIATALPELRAKLDPFIRNPNAYTAAFAILDAPGIKPSVRPGFSRDEPLGRIDNLRDNWWCTTSPNHPYSGEDKPASAPPALFISKSDRERAAAERTSIDKLGPAPNYFGSVVLAWARTHREDPTVPEALHRVVRATRYGCTDSGTTAISRAAFQLLHSRYPASEWAKKTPYHF